MLPYLGISSTFAIAGKEIDNSIIKADTFKNEL